MVALGLRSLLLVGLVTVSSHPLRALPDEIVKAISDIATDAQYKTLTDYISLSWKNGNYEELEEINKLIEKASQDWIALRDGYARSHYKELYLPKDLERLVPCCCILPLIGLTVIVREKISMLDRMRILFGSLLIASPVIVPFIIMIVGMKDDFNYKWQDGQKRIERFAHLHSMLDTLLMIKATNN